MAASFVAGVGRRSSLPALHLDSSRTPTPNPRQKSDFIAAAGRTVAFSISGTGNV